MQIHFLGGASRIGATCQLVTSGNQHLLIDAGIRSDAPDRLPDLAALEGRSLDAIVITHAHADHIGALPLVHAQHPATPIYASPATLCLIQIMLADATRVMARRAADELELPLYDDALVAATLQRLRPLQPGTQNLPELPDITLYAKRAGHIAGAISLGLVGPDGRLVVSGDVSVTPQRTILGAAPFAPIHPDLLVLESTYGARMHPNRTVEERRLAEAVAAVIERGGHCLLPAFALGRAQEIISILRAAQRDGHIPPFPIAVDGLVRSVCAAYTAIPAALTPALQRHITGGGRPFFGKTVAAVETPRQREHILAGVPAAIISSSGMLTGGPSVWYAERLVEHGPSAILFSGYQDDEAPGYRLLNLADAPAAERRMTFGETTRPVVCGVGRYNLSAHADGEELLALVRAAQPRSVALVHGDPEARATMAARLRDLTEVVLPQDGETITFGRTHQARTPASTFAPAMPLEPIGTPGTVPQNPGDLEQLWLAVRDGSGTQTMHVRALAQRWGGPDVSEEQTALLLAHLEAGTVFFKALPMVAGLWRVVAATDVRRAQAAPGHTTSAFRPRIDQVGIQAIIDRYLGDRPDLYQRSIDLETGAVTLRYFFPDIAQVRDARALQAIAAEAGVNVSVSPHPHQGQLAAAATALVPPGVTLTRHPAIQFERHTVALACIGSADASALQRAAEHFLASTGWRLAFEGLAAAAGVPVTADQPASPHYAPPADATRMEVNAALTVVRQQLRGDAAPTRIGADQGRGVLTLRFAFPDVAEAHHQEQLRALAARTGWSITVWPQPNHQALFDAAVAALPAGVQVVGVPSLQAATRTVIVAVRGAAADAEVAQAAAAFQARTGFGLVVRGATPT